MDFPHGSDSKESACNAEDMGSIPESGRSPGEGNGYPLQYFCLRNPMYIEPDRLPSMGWERVRYEWACTHTQIYMQSLLSIITCSGTRKKGRSKPANAEHELWKLIWYHLTKNSREMHPVKYYEESSYTHLNKLILSKQPWKIKSGSNYNKQNEMPVFRASSLEKAV